MRVHITLTDDNGDTYGGTIDLTKIDAKTSSTTKKKPKIHESTTIEGPADAIRILYQKQHFKTEKTRGDVVKALKTMGYNFDPDTVSMALNRSPFLRKEGSKGNYRFIQKYPSG